MADSEKRPITTLDTLDTVEHAPAPVALDPVYDEDRNYRTAALPAADA